MSSVKARAAALLLLAALAGCGDLPQPFLGRPGATAERLAQPPPSRLSIPTPENALLTDDAAQAWATALADNLDAQELPARAGPAGRGDWSLRLTAELRGDAVVPSFTVLNPARQPQGTSEGAPVPARDWAAGQPATFQAAAAAETPKLIAMLNGIEARREMSDPHSLLNRPPVVYFTGVTGAPGDGNTSLARQMALKLPAQGDLLQDSAKGADFTVAGQVRTAPGQGKTTRIEIQWIVTSATGENGRVVQLNEVPIGSLDSYWGEVAVVVAQEAAGGIQEVISNSIDKARKVEEAKSVPGAASAPAPKPPAAQ